MKTIAENLQIIKDSTEAIKQAIIDKGGTIEGDITTYANAIRNLENNFDDNGHNYKVVVQDNTIIDPRNTITKIIIPAKIKIIGSEAFAEYYQLQYIDFESDSELTSIGEFAFASCESLTSITLPASVTEIENGAFASCTGLTSITIPENSQLTSIGNDVFSNCNSLQSITIPENVTSIGEFAFADCNSLTSINIPVGVTNIELSAFSYCNSLTTINIPEDVTSIGDQAFAGCTGLTSITCNAVTPPTIDGSYTFYSVNKSIPIYVPADSIEVYKAANYWKDFTNIQAL